MEKLIESLHTIKDECKSHTNCERCPLGDPNGSCKIDKCYPEDWGINDNIPRALL